MPIITKSSPIAKDAPITFTLDKAALAALPVVVASAWYGDTANWKKVTINYKSTSDNEMLIVSFDATQSSPTGSLLVISPSKDVFEAISMTIVDFNNGTFRVPSTSLDQADFVVNFESSVTYIDYNSLPSEITADAFGGVTVPVGTSTNYAKAIGTSYIGQDFLFTFNIEATLPAYFTCIVSSTTTPYSASGIGVGFWSYASPHSVQVLLNGSPAGDEIPLLPSGNTLKIQRISGNVYLYANDVLAYTIVGFNPSAETYPAIKPTSGTPVTSSTVIF